MKCWYGEWQEERERRECFNDSVGQNIEQNINATKCDITTSSPEKEKYKCPIYPERKKSYKFGQFVHRGLNNKGS